MWICFQYWSRQRLYHHALVAANHYSHSRCHSRLFLVEGEGFGSKGGEQDSDEEIDDEGEERFARGHTNDTSPTHGPTFRKTAPRADLMNENAISDDPDDVLENAHPLRKTTSRSMSAGRGQLRRGSKILPPFGTGEGIIPRGARRLSSDLGATRSGLGTGGTAFQ